MSVRVARRFPPPEILEHPVHVCAQCGRRGGTNFRPGRARGKYICANRAACVRRQHRTLGSPTPNGPCDHCGRLAVRVSHGQVVCEYHGILRDAGWHCTATIPNLQPQRDPDSGRIDFEAEGVRRCPVVGSEICVYDGRALCPKHGHDLLLRWEEDTVLWYVQRCSHDARPAFALPDWTEDVWAVVVERLRERGTEIEITSGVDRDGAERPAYSLVPILASVY